MFDFISAPQVTEKAVDQQALGKYTFLINKSSASRVNKIEIAKAVESLWNVKVENINICKNAPKKRNGGRRREIVKRPTVVKAIVTLKKGQSIDFANIKEKKTA